MYVRFRLSGLTLISPEKDQRYVLVANVNENRGVTPLTVLESTEAVPS